MLTRPYFPPPSLRPRCVLATLVSPDPLKALLSSASSIARHGGTNHQRCRSESVRSIDIPSFIFSPFLTAFLVSSLEDAMLKALKTHLSPPVETTSNPHNEFYNNFQRTADAHDRDFLTKYGGDLDTTLIFVGFFFSYPFGV